MTSSDDVLTRHTWKPGCVCLNMIMHSETFSLEGNQAVKFSMFIKNDTGNRYGFSYGLQLQALDVMGSVDLQVKVCVEDEYGWKSEDRVVYCMTFKAVGDKCEFVVPDSGEERQIFVRSYHGNSNLTVHCELKCRRHPPKAALPLRQLVWSTTYNKGTGTDVTIQVEDKEFKVSSMILVCQSKVFERMLSSNKFKESESKVIVIEDATPLVVESFIRYLYLGTVEDSDPIEELFDLGDKYMIPDLMTRCATLMIETLTIENVTRRLIISRLHSEEETLTPGIQAFVEKMGMQTEVYESETWREYLNGHSED